MKVNVDVKIELRNKKGEIVKVLKKRCHSYIQQLIYILHTLMASYTGAEIVDTGGTARGIYYTGSQWENGFQAAAVAADNTYGIQVGTGENAVQIADHVLQTLIAEGATSTKLNYGSVSVGAVVIVGSTAKFTIARTLTNNSGADITVKEVGLTSNSSVYNRKFLFERTLLSFTVANGTSGTVTYTISVTV